ncbi:MAG: hypothetical protein ACYTG0_04800 [Planctomycetota bacterium]|jgi:hypothetical protein
MATTTDTSPDVYTEWLGIPPGPRPPNHYLLLGIVLYESDFDMIRRAADERTKSVRPRCLKRPELGTQILNEIAKARVCLTDPRKKKTYDEGLRAAADRAAVQPGVEGAKRPQPLATGGPPSVPSATHPSEPQKSEAGSFALADAWRGVRDFWINLAPNLNPTVKKALTGLAAAGLFMVSLVIGSLVLGRAADYQPDPEPANVSPESVPVPPDAETAGEPESAPPHVPVPGEVRFVGHLLAVHCAADEVHLLIRPEDSSAAVPIEAFTTAPRFADEIVDYRTAREVTLENRRPGDPVAVSHGLGPFGDVPLDSRVAADGTPFDPQAGDYVEVRAIATDDPSRAPYLPMARLVELQEINRVGEPSSKAMAGQSRSPMTFDRQVHQSRGPLMRLLRTPGSGAEERVTGLLETYELSEYALLRVDAGPIGLLTLDLSPLVDSQKRYLQSRGSLQVSATVNYHGDLAPNREPFFVCSGLVPRLADEPKEGEIRSSSARPPGSPRFDDDLLSPGEMEDDEDPVFEPSRPTPPTRDETRKGFVGVWWITPGGRIYTRAAKDRIEGKKILADVGEDCATGITGRRTTEKVAEAEANKQAKRARPGYLQRQKSQQRRPRSRG